MSTRTAQVPGTTLPERLLEQARHQGTWAWTAVLALAVVVVAVGVAARYDALAALLAAVGLAFGVAAAARWPSLLLYLYAASIPLNFVVPAGPAGTVARVVGIVFVVGYLARRLRIVRAGVLPVAMWALLGWLLVSTLWAIDPQVSFNGWLSLAQLAAVTLLIASIVARDPAEMDRVLWAYASSAVATAVIAIVSYLQNPAIFLTRAAAFDAEDPALFASALLPAVLYLVYRVTTPETRPVMRALSAAAALACVAAVALSGTRSAWLGLAVAGAVWLVLRPSARLIAAFATVAVAVVLVVVLVPGAGSYLLDRAGTAAVSGGAGRTDLWTVGLTAFQSSPIVGVGFANFPLAFTQQAIDLSPISVLGAEDLVAGRGSHNVLLASLVETGVIGATLLSLTMFAVLRRTGPSAAGAIVRVMLICLLVQALLLDILLQKQLWLVVAIGLGLGAARVRGPRTLVPAAATARDRARRADPARRAEGPPLEPLDVSPRGSPRPRRAPS